MQGNRANRLHPLRHCSLFIVLLFIILAVAYTLASPIYEPTDELRHFRYIRHIAVYHNLPVQGADTPRAQSHHPPLYYVLGALVSSWIPITQDVYYSPPENPFWGYRRWEVSADNKNLYIHSNDERFPFHGVTLAVYLVRWMTVLIGAGVVWLTYRIGQEIVPAHPALALGGAAIVALNPQFLYLSGAINNDVPAALCGAAVLLASIRLVQKGPSLRRDVTLGALFGLSLLTKFNLLALGLPIALAYLIAVWPAPQPKGSEGKEVAEVTPTRSHSFDWRDLLRGVLVILGLAAVISGWWFWRNWVLYDDPTGMKAVNDLWAGRSAFSSGDMNWWAIRQGVPYLWSSLWGRFGYGQVPMPSGIYWGILIFCLLALTGYLIPRRGVAHPPDPLLLSGITFLAFVAVVFYYILIQPAGAMGRFLFPGLPGLATLLAVGVSRFFPRRMTWVAGLCILVCMTALTVYALVGVLNPAFARPRPLTAEEVKALPHSAEMGTNVEFEGVARLLGYQVTPQEVQPGGEVKVTLYWQALAQTERNLVVFVHLLSDWGEATSLGTMVAQRDTYPGLGSYPTTAWEPGVVFADTYRVHVPETAYAPDRGYIQIGMYVPDGPRLTVADGVASLPSINEDGVASLPLIVESRDAVRLATVGIQPLPGELPNPLAVTFGADQNKLMLTGYTLTPRVAHPGDTISLTLYWRALAPMKENYKAFAHVLGVENQVWANSDHRLVDSGSPTSWWQTGVIVEDVHELTVGMTTPPDFYDIEVGVYAQGEGRLPVMAENGHQLGDRMLLNKIRVIEDE